MNCKLWFLNLLLLAMAVFSGWQLRNRWLAEKARESVALGDHVALIPAPPFTIVPVPPTAPPGIYANIAQKDLFNPSRNPEVIIENSVVPLPSPMLPPPLPVFYGEMNIGDGPMAILSVNQGGPQHAIRPGEMIGPFKLIDVTRQDLTLEWDGRVLRKSLDALGEHRTAPLSEAATEGRREAPPAQSHQPPTANVQASSNATAYVLKTCGSGDSTRGGTVEDGFLKTQVLTPFGVACLWNPLGK